MIHVNFNMLNDTEVYNKNFSLFLPINPTLFLYANSTNVYIDIYIYSNIIFIHTNTQTM